MLSVDKALEDWLGSGEAEKFGPYTRHLFTELVLQVKANRYRIEAKDDEPNERK